MSWWRDRRAKPIVGKTRVKQKKGNNENWRVLNSQEIDTHYAVQTIALALAVAELHMWIICKYHL